jgi:hypothetical protein
MSNRSVELWLAEWTVLTTSTTFLNVCIGRLPKPLYDANFLQRNRFGKRNVRFDGTNA